jgi:hypothetical protein
MSAQAPLAVLARLRRRPTVASPGERCEMCGEGIPDDHGHVVDLDSRRLLCACRACYLLFTSTGAGGGRRRAVPRRYASVSDFSVDGRVWDALQIPVGIAFFVRASRPEGGEEVSAFYPGPAGATESLLPLDAWEEVVTANPVLAGVEPDVEAVLVRLLQGAAECFVVPVDACYELVGNLRRLWRGFDGGSEARSYLSQFFDDLRRRTGAGAPAPAGGPAALGAPFGGGARVGAGGAGPSGGGAR